MIKKLVITVLAVGVVGGLLVGSDVPSYVTNFSAYIATVPPRIQSNYMVSIHTATLSTCLLYNHIVA